MSFGAALALTLAVSCFALWNIGSLGSTLDPDSVLDAATQAGLVGN